MGELITNNGGHMGGGVLIEAGEGSGVLGGDFANMMNSQQKLYDVAAAASFSFFLGTVTFCLLTTGVVLWLRWRTPSNYHKLMVALLWLFPIAFESSWTFTYMWLAFSVTSGSLFFLLRKRPLDKATPGLVYMFYNSVYSLCYLAIWCGLVSALLVDTAGITVLFYGLYFGVLGRELCAMSCYRISQFLGFAAGDGKQLPRRVVVAGQCAACGGSVNASGGASTTIACGHTFHDACIRGWSLVGKRDTCPGKFTCCSRFSMTTFRCPPREN
jgi:RING finger protein 121